MPTNDNLSNIHHLTWRDKRYKQFYQIVDQLVEEIQDHVWIGTGKKKRRVRNADLAKLTYSVECIIRDCMVVVYGRKRAGETTIYRGQYYYGSSRPDQMLTYKIHIKRAFDGLLELGYLRITKDGFHAREPTSNNNITSQLTRYVAGSRLISLFKDSIDVLPAIIPPYIDPEPIKIQSKGNDELGILRRFRHAFDDTPASNKMLENLSVINKSLSKNWYDLDLDHEELHKLAIKRAPKGKPPRPVNFNRRFVHRIFGDINLESGGRFYGGWWEDLPRDYRKYILINGKRTVELDYSSMHPQIVYALAGKKMPKDAYSDFLLPKMFPKGSYNFDEDPMADFRNMIKRSLNSMLNSEKETTRPPRKRKKKDYNPSDFGLTWKEVKGAILEFHHPIKEYFFSGLGGKLQRLDSHIAEETILHFARKNIPVLPVHDSFIMHHGYENELRDAMGQMFKKVIGESADIRIDKKERKISVMKDSDELADEFEDDSWLTEYLNRGHEKRLMAFRQLSHA